MLSLRQKFGRAVRRLRRQEQYSQEAFADACALHRTYIGSIERGEVNISLDNIEKVAGTLGIPVSRLFVEAERER